MNNQIATIGNQPEAELLSASKIFPHTRVKHIIINEESKFDSMKITDLSRIRDPIQSMLEL